MNRSPIEQRIDETALAMLDLSPEDRERCFCEAFDITLANYPDLTEVPPVVVEFVAAVYRRIAELERPRRRQRMRKSRSTGRP
jgi:hypothetical protein